MMNDSIRISDADREQVTARLRENFAEGRLTSEELDGRITATLNAKTYGDLRPIMADLPGPGPVPPYDWAVPPAGGQTPPPGAPPWGSGPMGGQYRVYRRGPRLLPLVLIAVVFALAFPWTGFFFFGFLKLMLLMWLVIAVAGLFARRGRRRGRRW
jgi:Domain of unknown function (DUF1707)